ncbi:MAG TPA: hypothetical protein PLP23_08875 [Panacibacter sp.]|nr:hypothetical protein [Panacibacter sp.]
MKEYQFQYTKMWQTLIVVLLAIATFIATEFIGIFNKLNLVLTIALGFGLAFSFFQFFKKKAIHNCIAKLGDTSVIFEFENETKTINFNELTSYKSYYGKNGPVLYLKNNIDNFQISANNNFCKIDDFKSFCEDAITQLDKYREKSNLELIHEGSIFATKAMLYFLIVATSIYLLAFFIETRTLRLAIGISGGFYFFIMWTKYFIEQKNLRDQNGS